MLSVLQQEQRLAEQKTDQLVRHLQTDQPSMDSIWMLTHGEESYLYYIFDDRRMLYWSDNWLVADNILLHSYDNWWYGQCRNAHVVGRWTRAGMLNVLTIIPIKYAFTTSDLALHNSFVPPFRGEESLVISRAKHDDAFSVSNTDGQPLFYLSSGEVVDQPVREDWADHWRLHTRARLSFHLLILLFGVLICWGVFSLVRSRGYSNLSLRAKFLYVVVSLLVFFFLYVFFMSVRYVGSQYERRQMRMLESKCNYVASSLRGLYYWDLSLSAANTPSLNMDLADLSKVYGTDINVYNLQGELVGTSAPGWFDDGVLSQRISPALLFSSDSLTVRHEFVERRPYLSAYTLLHNGSGVPLGYVATPYLISSHERHQEIDRFTVHLLPPCLLALLLAVAVCYALSRLITLPLSRLSDSLSHFTLGVRAQHIDYVGHDEVGELVQHYNQLLDQLQDATSRMAQSERESAWRTMARQIAHEVNNPLTPMRLRIQQLRRLRQDDDPRFDQYFRETTTMLIEQIDNLSHIASSFSTFAKLPEVTTSEVDVARILSSTICLFQTNAENIPVRYVGPDSGIRAFSDPQQLPEVFTNIIKNALQALDGKRDGDVIVRLTDDAVISISDNGSGIPEEYRERVFLPNFTTKSTGTGLGLAISKNIIEQSGGHISFETSERGTTFYIYLKQSL